MPKSHSRKRFRDADLHAAWDARPEADFTALGVTRAALKAAQGQLQGHIVLPGDPLYDEGRMLANPVFSPSPSMIVFCLTEADVAVALTLSTGHSIPFTVRSGGHCTAGFSSGMGVLIDVKGLNAIHIDPVAQKAIVGTGVTFGVFNQMLDQYGLHVPGGECEDVCVGGFVQGGGLGFTSTTFGMNCDNAYELRVMLADTSIVTCNYSVNMDLFYAMRGGTGGNFGILLSVKYNLYPLTSVYGMAVAWPLVTPADIASATNVMMALQASYMANSPYAPHLTLQVLVVYQTILDPAQPPLPAAIPVFMVRGMWVGDANAGAAAMAPIAQMPGAVVQWSGSGSYVKVLDKLANYPQDQPITPTGAGTPNEDKACRYVARNLQPAEWSAIFTLFVTQAPNLLTYMYLEFYGGKIATPGTPCAFIHRDVHFNAVLDVYWYRPAERAANEAFLNLWITQLETCWNHEVYQNYVSINVPDYRHNYWGKALPALIKAKKKYDPNRAFVFAQMVPYTLTGPTAQAAIAPDLAAALAAPIDYTGGYCAADKG